jgi:mono/diheme cytochrome c family protein
MYYPSILRGGKLAAALALVATLNLSANADATKLPPAAAKANVTFASDIKPIFETSCVKCHGDDRPKAGLRLTNLESTLKGSKEGKVVEPGDSAKSQLVLSVAYLGEEDH